MTISLNSIGSMYENLSFSIKKRFHKNYLNVVENHFERLHHKKQETLNNYFWSIKCSTTLLQLITGEHECQKVTAKVIFNLILYIILVA